MNHILKARLCVLVTFTVWRKAKKGARGTVMLRGPYWLARGRSLPSNLGQKDKGWTVALAELKRENVSEIKLYRRWRLHGSVGCGRERNQSWYTFLLKWEQIWRWGNTKLSWEHWAWEVDEGSVIFMDQQVRRKIWAGKVVSSHQDVSGVKPCRGHADPATEPSKGHQETSVQEAEWALARAECQGWTPRELSHW